MSRIPALSYPPAVCRSTTASISARETAIDLWTAQIHVCAGNHKLFRISRGHADLFCRCPRFQRVRFFRRHTGVEVADQHNSRKSRSLRGVWRGIADRINRYRRLRRAALSAVPLVVGIALRMGIKRMLTEFFRPSDPGRKRITQTTFVIEKKLTERASLFVEYVGD